jgi:hypothetical protein
MFVVVMAGVDIPPPTGRMEPPDVPLEVPMITPPPNEVTPYL